MSPYRTAPPSLPRARRHSMSVRLFRAGRERRSSPLSAGQFAVNCFSIAVSVVLFTPAVAVTDVVFVAAFALSAMSGLLFILARGWRRCRRMCRTIYVHRTMRPRTPLDDFMDRCDAAIQADGSD